MATLSTTQTGASPEYLRYSYGTVTKTDRVGAPNLLDFSLLPGDASFVKLLRGAYLTLTTTAYGIWFTGFITNDAELAFLGSTTVAGVKTPVFGYVYQATSDEYLLNLKPIGIVPPFVNTTQGAVLRYLVDLLSPAGWVFDVSGIQDGQQITRYVVDTTKKFSDIVTEFATAANYQFKIVNKVATYVRQDLAACGIAVDGASEHFTPSRLTLQPVADPVVNDVIVLGDIEPQAYFNEYFVGDGATASFPLANGVYGVDSTILLDDNFSSSTVDTSKWTLYDTINSYLQPLGGFLNVLGGNNTGAFDVYLQSRSLIPLEGNLRLTHGEFDFVVAGDGIIASLWTQDCSSVLTNCVYGIRCVVSGATTTLYPIVQGVVDTTQSVVVDYTKRYDIRTLVGIDQACRLTPQHSYRGSNGTVGAYGGTSKPATAYFQTVITVIDPTSGLMSGQSFFMNANVTLTPAQTYGYYCPVVSNSLNLTVTGVTISSPMQTNLEVLPVGATAFQKLLMGPNEIDTQDGLAPAATVVDSNSGSTARSTVLGTPVFNAGQATLTFFKNTIQEMSTTPPVAEVVHLAYRVPGAAMARVRNRATISTESAAFKDDGLRTAIVNNMSPLPRTAEECEQGAAAYVSMYGYQHYQGTYAMPSGLWFSSEPQSGTVLLFKNMGAIPGFPAYLEAEAVTDVVTTLDGNIRNTGATGFGVNPFGASPWGDVSASPMTEIFTHTLTFGPTNRLAAFLSTLRAKTDVFVIQDTAEIPSYVDVGSVGMTHSLDITSPRLTSWDASLLHFDTGVILPAGCQFEVRYSDNSWGAADAGNLIERVASGTTFTVPRDNRGKVCYIKAHDTRNVFIWSDDLTKMTPLTTGYPLVNVMGKNPENSHAMVSVYTPSTSFPNIGWASGLAPANLTGCWSISVLGAVGTTFSMSIYNGTMASSFTATATCSGGWQRLSVPFTWGAGATGAVNYQVTASAAVQLCHASTEIGVTAETAYCATNGAPYGALSRFPAGIRVSLPLIPPPPTAVVSIALPAPVANATAYAGTPSAIVAAQVTGASQAAALGTTSTTIPSVVITLSPPTLAEYVWGFQIRAVDQVTVLYSEDLSSATYNPQVSFTIPPSRVSGYYCYCYNLLGEYSAPLFVEVTVPTPTMTTGMMSVVDATKQLTWSCTAGTGALQFLVEVASDSAFTLDYGAVTTTNYSVTLDDATFFTFRYFRVTPSDAVGSGTAYVISHDYIPTALAELTSHEVSVITPPPSAATPVITVPPAFTNYGTAYSILGMNTWRTNTPR